jgi:DHHC palmitoyltransferase
VLCLENIYFLTFLLAFAKKSSAISTRVILLLLFIFQQFLHIRCILSRPGMAIFERVEFEEPLSESEAAKYFCRDCDMIRWHGVRHCDKCQVCVNSCAGHSILIGKCIGVKNSMLYWIYVLLTGLLLLYSLYFLTVALRTWLFSSVSTPN